ncbi:hypothetical protein RSAG8_04755, partial [Rhizoctonia solani AG-8 WAC10335]
MFTFAQPAYRCYSPYEELAMQQELQRRRQMEAYLRRQREVDEMERRRREYEAAVRAEYEQRREAELERRRQAELQRRRQAQLARGRHSMYDGGVESLFDALYGGNFPRQARPWGHQQEVHQSNVTAGNRPTSTPVRDSTPTQVPVSAPAPAEPKPTPELELEHAPQVDTTLSYAAVQSILFSLATRQSDFTFPTQLDFVPGTSKLAYTPNNAPLHGYEHALTGLLTQLDAVESCGDDGVRKARKEAVKTIETELERLDGMKAEMWNRASGPQPEPEPVKPSTETEVGPISVPLPAEDEDAQDEEMEDCFTATVSESSTTDRRSVAPGDSIQTEPTTSPEAEHSTSLEPCIDTDLAQASPPPTADTQPVHPDDAVLGTPQPYTPTAEPLARSLTSPSPWEVSDSDSDSDLEIEECVDVETMSTSEDEGTDLEKVENNGDLELMGDWDLDF